MPASKYPLTIFRLSASPVGDRRSARAPCHRMGPPVDEMTGVTAFAFAVAVARDVRLLAACASIACAKNVTVHFRTAEDTHAGVMAPIYRSILVVLRLHGGAVPRANRPRRRFARTLEVESAMAVVHQHVLACPRLFPSQPVAKTCKYGSGGL